jgi:hypothetical protein
VFNYFFIFFNASVDRRSQVGCGPTANYLFCFAKKGNPKKATVDLPLRGAYASLQHNLCVTKNGKVLKLAFGSNNNTFLSIFCEAQITSSQTGVGQKQGQKQSQKQSQKQRPTTAIGKLNAVGIDCFGVVVVFDFNAVPLLTLPIVRGRNGKKRVRCLSVASF